MLTFSQPVHEAVRLDEIAQSLREDGFHRWILDGRTASLADSTASDLDASSVGGGCRPPGRGGVLTRLGCENRSKPRWGRSGGRCDALIDLSQVNGSPLPDTMTETTLESTVVDERTWHRFPMTRLLRCDACALEFPRLEPRLFSFNSPRGACPTCEGFGNISDLDFELIIPDPGKSLAEGAIAPWTTPAYEQEMQKVLELAPQMGIPTDVPFGEPDADAARDDQTGITRPRVWRHCPGFFDWLERRKYKIAHPGLPQPLAGFSASARIVKARGFHRRVSACGLAIAISLKSARCERMKPWPTFDSLKLTAHDERVSKQILDQVQSRLRCLHDMGLEYLSLDRPMRTLSTGERQRVALTSVLGSSLVNMLYVLDEPSTGLHPSDVGKLIEAVHTVARPRQLWWWSWSTRRRSSMPLIS